MEWLSVGVGGRGGAFDLVPILVVFQLEQIGGQAPTPDPPHPPSTTSSGQSSYPNEHSGQGQGQGQVFISFQGDFQRIDFLVEGICF